MKQLKLVWVETSNPRGQVAELEEAFKRELDKEVSKNALALTDRMELQLMGIKP